MKEPENLLIIDPFTDIDIIKALASEPRMQMLFLIKEKALNINEIGAALKMPQSTVATHIEKLEEAGLLNIEALKAKKGSQKICSPAYNNYLIKFPELKQNKKSNISVEMPIGLFTDFHVNAPCGLCSTAHIIGFLDMSDTFFNPERMSAQILWFTSGYVEYKFPNNSFYESRKISKIEFCAEISAQTNIWNSDITLTINNAEAGTWTSPPGSNDKPVNYLPQWWTQGGPQHGLLKSWTVTDDGSFIDDEKISDITISDLHLSEHHSIKIKLAVKDDAKNQGGIIIFGKSFGSYPQDLILKIYFKDGAPLSPAQDK
ncbi:MAG: ArsR family transcriptional regulator [Treponema sp.]|nr:ArsR family transcriptional regulator [Treponema sp.]